MMRALVGKSFRSASNKFHFTFDSSRHSLYSSRKMFRYESTPYVSNYDPFENENSFADFPGYAHTEVENSFFLCDLSKIDSKFEEWINHFPRIAPFYAVKCNSDIEILRRLAELGSCFDCASEEEIRIVLSLGVSPKKIIFANPCKQTAHLKYAKQVGVNTCTFDNEEELIKIKKYHPNCNVVMRIYVDTSKAICQLGMKFGAPKDHVEELIKKCKDLDLNLSGFSFHVGSGCLDQTAFEDAIKESKAIYDLAKSLGFNVNLLDIGGGFPGLDDSGVSIRTIAKTVHEAINNYYADEITNENFRVIAEPGRFFAATAMNLVTTVVSKREMKSLGKQMIYLSDGVYGSFNCVVFDHFKIPSPIILDSKFKMKKIEDTEEMDSSLWGPTCDSADIICDHILLPKLEIDDKLMFKNMGAYSVASSTNFNGFNIPKAIYRGKISFASKRMNNSYQYNFNL